MNLFTKEIKSWNQWIIKFSLIKCIFNVLLDSPDKIIKNSMYMRVLCNLNLRAYVAHNTPESRWHFSIKNQWLISHSYCIQRINFHSISYLNNNFCFLCHLNIEFRIGFVCYLRHQFCCRWYILYLSCVFFFWPMWYMEENKKIQFY